MFNYFLNCKLRVIELCIFQLCIFFFDFSCMSVILEANNDGNIGSQFSKNYEKSDYFTRYNTPIIPPIEAKSISDFDNWIIFLFFFFHSFLTMIWHNLIRTLFFSLWIVFFIFYFFVSISHKNCFAGFVHFYLQLVCSYSLKRFFVRTLSYLRNSRSDYIYRWFLGFQVHRRTLVG